MHISWARLASFCHLGVISDTLIVSKSPNETDDPKGQGNKVYTIVKGRETFYRRHKVPVTSCSEVKYVHKRVSFESKECTKELCRVRAGKGLTHWLSFVASNCEFVTFPLVSWVWCGTWLYRLLIFGHLLTFSLLMFLSIRSISLSLIKLWGKVV